MIPDQLKQVAERVRNGENPRETIRTILGWFGVRRRGYLVTDQIREAMDSEGLATLPDFQYSYIDSQVEFVSLAELYSAHDEALQRMTQEESLSQDKDPTYRVRMLAAANHEPVTVTPDDTLAQAVTLMLANDYSQLPVMTTPRDLKGIISWKSIAARLSLSRACDRVRLCMDSAFEVAEDTSIFKAIPLIVENDCVLVRDKTETICGLITTADLALQFKQLGEPFLLLGQIENRIRRLIGTKFSQTDLATLNDPDDPSRKIERISDLTFGEYVRLLEDPSRWSRLNINIDRASFIKLLDKTRQIRNDVMHFDPDGIDHDDLESLRSFSLFLERLDELCPQTLTKV